MIDMRVFARIRRAGLIRRKRESRDHFKAAFRFRFVCLWLFRSREAWTTAKSNLLKSYSTKLRLIYVLFVSSKDKRQINVYGKVNGQRLRFSLKARGQDVHCFLTHSVSQNLLWWPKINDINSQRFSPSFNLEKCKNKLLFVIFP